MKYLSRIFKPPFLFILATVFVIGYSLILGGFVLGSHLTIQEIQNRQNAIEISSQSSLPSFSPDFALGEKPIIKKVEQDIEIKRTGLLQGKEEFTFGLFYSNPINLENPRYYIGNFDGEIIGAYEIINKKGGILGDLRLLEDGNLLISLFHDGIWIVDREGNILWEYYDDISHHAEILRDREGKETLLTISAYADWAKEIDMESKKVVWEWNLADSFPSYDINGISGGDKFVFKSAYSSYNLALPLFPNDKSHLNSIQYIPKTDTFLLSLRNFDLVIEIDRIGKVLWSFGPGILKQQHTPRITNRGTMLIFDNGNERAIEIDRKTQEILWESNPFYSPIMGDVNIVRWKHNEEIWEAYKITASMEGRIFFEQEGEIIWEAQVLKNGKPAVAIYRSHFGEMEGSL